jgi:hypothetical protein
MSAPPARDIAYKIVAAWLLDEQGTAAEQRDKLVSDIAHALESYALSREQRVIAKARLEQCKTTEQIIDDAFTIDEVKRYLDRRIDELEREASQWSGG